MIISRSLPRSIHGFTLLEVLIALVVLSVGLLGLAALQTRALRDNHSAYLRSQANILAYDIIDRMRSNKATADAAGYDRTLGQALPSFTDCTAASCTGPQLAAYEINNWIQRVSAALPSGDGEVARAGSVVTVTVAWDDDRSGAPNQSFAMSTQL